MRAIRRLLGVGALAAGLVAWLAAGCEAIFDGQLGNVGCDAAAEGLTGAPACPEGLVCLAGECTTPAWGAACTSDTDCLLSEFCLDPESVGGIGPRACTRVCCTSGDCDPDPKAVCWTPPEGGGAFCRAAADLELGQPGTARPLGRCSTGADCRSGRCADGHCVDTCCTDTSCAPDGACRVGGPPAEPAIGFWCGAPTGTAAAYASCSGDKDCSSGLCLDFGLPYPVCSTPCCSSDDCAPTGGIPVRCVMLEGAHAGVRACMADVQTGTGAVGLPCTQDVDCRGGMCVELQGRYQCTDLCCSDDSCGENASTEVCRPAMVQGSWALRCEPK